MNNEEKTILVTGGSGFIGSVTCKLLVDSGYNVINIDRVKRQQEGVTQYPFDIDNHQLKGVIELTKPYTINQKNETVGFGKFIDNSTSLINLKVNRYHQVYKEYAEFLFQLQLNIYKV